ncbi:MAG: GAF domain-containing sensor histidine kinase [Armatimonadetes bacterium]|nr:GAF domain-containing sensor histidine kinase [Armatimonadota bacterium]
MVALIAVLGIVLEASAVRLPGMGFVGPALSCYLALALMPGAGMPAAFVVILIAVGLRTALRGYPGAQGRLSEAVCDAFPVTAGAAAAHASSWVPAVFALQACLLAWWLSGPMLARILPSPAYERWLAVRERLFPVTIATAFCGVGMASMSGWNVVWLIPVAIALRGAAGLLVRGEEEERRLFLAQELRQAQERLDTAARAHTRLRDDLQGKLEEYVVLEDLAGGLSRTARLQETLDLVLEKTQRLVPFQHAAVFLVQAGRLQPFAASGAQADRMLSEEPIVDRAWRNSVAQQTRSALCTGDSVGAALPLGTAQGRRIGILFLTRNEEFTQKEIRLLTIVANQAAVAVESGYRWEAQQAALREQVEAYRKLQESEAQLVQSTKMAAVGQLAAGVAHELNTPLGAVHLALDMAQKMLPNQWEKAVERLQRATRSVKHAQDIIERLLYYSRDARKGRVPTDLAAVARDAVDLIEHQLRLDKVEVEAALAEVPTVTCNQNEIYQVITNLLLNARDALVASGRTDQPIRLTLAENGGAAFIQVMDAGPPIPAEIQSRIFEPFFTTKAVGEGTGLGLSVSHEIVSQHGGSLTMTSTAESGPSSRWRFRSTCRQVHDHPRNEQAPLRRRANGNRAGR